MKDLKTKLKILDKEKVIKFSYELHYTSIRYKFNSDENGKAIEPYQIIDHELNPDFVTAPPNEANKHNFIEEMDNSYNVLFPQLLNGNDYVKTDLKEGEHIRKREDDAKVYKKIWFGVDDTPI